MIGKLVVAAAALCMFLPACTDEDVVQPDPTPQETIDSVRVTQMRFSDTVDILVVQQNATGSKQSSVYDTSRTQRPAQLTLRADSLTTGKIVVKLLGTTTSPFEAPTELWNHTFTGDRSTWVVSETLTAKVGAIRITSERTTGVVRGTLIFGQ